MAVGASVELGGEIVDPGADCAKQAPALRVLSSSSTASLMSSTASFIGRSAVLPDFGASGSDAKFSVKMKREQAWRKLSGGFAAPIP